MNRRDSSIVRVGGNGEIRILEADSSPYGLQARIRIWPSGQISGGTGEGTRTFVVSLGGFCSTIELRPLRVSTLTSPLSCSGGGGWIRTNVGVSQQIYSLPPLATRAPLLQRTVDYGLVT